MPRTARNPPASENPRASSTRPAATRRIVRDREVIFDLNEEDVFWCTADIGWVTGHSDVVGGPFENGAISICEVAPDTPARDRFWDLVGATAGRSCAPFPRRSAPS
jgi:hypothetical protein